MTAKQFPPEFRSIWRQEGVKAAFVSEYERGPLEQTNGCQNCGGLGFFVTFLGMSGPFTYAPGVVKDRVSHWHDGKWWLGVNYTAPCPVCGEKRPAQQIQPVVPGARRGKSAPIGEIVDSFCYDAFDRGEGEAAP